MSIRASPSIIEPLKKFIGKTVFLIRDDVERNFLLKRVCLQLALNTFRINHPELSSQTLSPQVAA